MNPLPTWLVAATLAAFVPAQALDPAATLAKAQLLEQQEGDLAAAQQTYRALLDDAAAGAVHAEAALRLGALLWRLDQKQAGKPFLERAAAAGGDIGAEATLVLQGQGEQGKLAAERLEKARAIVRRYVELTDGPRDADGNLSGDANARLSALRRELLWLSEPGAQAIVEGIESLGREDTARSGVGMPTRGRARKALLKLLWQASAKSAADALVRWSEVDDLQVRRWVIEGAADGRVADPLVPVLIGYLKDQDPAGDVWASACDAIHHLPFAQHIALLEHADPRLQAAGLSALANERGRWTDQALSVRLAVDHGARIRQATHSADQRVASNAWRLLCRFASAGPREGTLLFLAEAERLPSGAVNSKTHLSVDGDDAWIHALAAAAQRSEPYAGGKQVLGHRDVIENLFEEHKPAWTAAALDDVCTLFERGYGRRLQATWVVYFWSHAKEQHLDRHLRTIAEDPAWPQLLLQLTTTRPLPTELFPTLRDLAEPMLQRSRMQVDAASATGQPSPPGLSSSRPARDPMESVIALVTQTNHPAAATWLAAIVDQRPDLVGLCAYAMVSLSLGGAGEPAHAGLRKLLIWPGLDDNQLKGEQRSQVFAELARVGDVAAIPLFPRAYELGLAFTEPRFAGNGKEISHQFRSAGLGFLGLQPDRDGLQQWHGYSDEHLVSAWRTLLSSAPADRLCAEFDSGLDPTTGKREAQGRRSSGFAVPVAVLPVLVEYLPRLWQVVGPIAQANWHQFEVRVGKPFDSAPAAAFEPGTPLHTQLQKLFRDADPDYAQTFFRYLPAAAAQRFAAEAHSILQGTRHRSFFLNMLKADIELAEREWTTVLGDVSPYVQAKALEHVPFAMASRVRPMVEKQIANPDELVQLAAITALQRLYGQDAVGTLLPLLQHSNEKVRTAARSGLDTLKQDHEQRAFWNNANTGVDLRPASAAAKLLTQAKAGEPKEQRLLAMRSLGVLATAESLPYLIDATKDQDPDIAAAARTAIAQIHNKSGAAESAKK